VQRVGPGTTVDHHARRAEVAAGIFEVDVVDPVIAE
jgi:hypothetical protein